MLPRVVSIVVAAGLLLAGGIHDRQLSQVGRPTTPSASLDEKLSVAVTRGDVPGLVVIAATRDGILYQGVFGKAETERERPMTADALFRIASMTKPVTSVAAMQLYEQGRFALDEPAEKYLPELANLMVFESLDNATGAYKLRPAATKVTIRHLFTHTSGLGYGFTSPSCATSSRAMARSILRVHFSSIRGHSGSMGRAWTGSGNWLRDSPGRI